MQLDIKLNTEPSESKGRVEKASKTKAAKEFQPEWNQVWNSGYTKPTGTVQKGIFQMKLSDPDKKRLLDVKEAIDLGELDAGVTDRKKFNKSHALRLHKQLLDQRKEQYIKEIVENIPSNYHSIQSAEQLDYVISLLNSTDVNALDTETTGLHYENDKVVGMSITIPSEDYHCYIPFLHENENVGEQLNKDYVLRRLQRECYDRKELITVMFNAKFDMHQLVKEGLTFVGKVYDTLVGMKLLNENEPSYQLKKLANKWGKYFGYTDDNLTFEELFSKDPKDFYIHADYRVCYYYACKDTDLTWKLWSFIEAQLKKHPELSSAFYDLEVPITKVAFEMEQEGMEIDLDYAAEYAKRLHNEVAELDEKIVNFFGEINWNSPVQVKKLLYTDLKLKSWNGKDSTDKQSLKSLSKEVPELSWVLERRSLVKLLSSFIEPIPQLAWSDGRIHAQYLQDGTKTFRFSSKNPNGQNLPYPARPMFVAPEGKLIVSTDLSQIEPRVLAHMSHDPLLQAPYLQGGDLYVDSALRMYGERYGMGYNQFLESDDETWRLKGMPKHPRKMFKQGLLATMYETSAFGLSTMLDVSVEDGQQFIDDFHSNFPTAYQYAKESIAFVDKYGYTLTMFGHKRRFPNHVNTAKEYHRLMAQAERITGTRIDNIWQADIPYKLKQQLGAVSRDYNTVIRQVVNARTQGSAAEVLKFGMIRTAEYLKSKGSEWKLISTIHDELLTEVPDTITEQEFKELNECMVGAVKLDIPLKSDVAVMKRWAEDVPLAEYLKRGNDCFDADGFLIK